MYNGGAGVDRRQRCSDKGLKEWGSHDSDICSGVLGKMDDLVPVHGFPAVSYDHDNIDIS
jgi:hypothetical protein